MKRYLHGIAFCIPAVLVSGCGESKPPATPSNHGSTQQSAGSGAKLCAEDSMVDSADKLKENTNPTLSGHEVAITKIRERDLPGNGGEVHRQLSVVLEIFDPATEKSWSETVARGSVVTIGGDRYCVVELEKGETEPGAIWIRKVGDT